LVSVAGGYEVIARDRLALRLGGAFVYTYLNDVSGYDHFASILVEPMLRVRLVARRLWLELAAGIGVRVVAGLARPSPLLRADASGSSTLALFDFRPGAALDVRVVDRVHLRAALDVSVSPAAAPLADAALVSFDPSLCAVVRF
jgi:hypothetical protein